MLYFLYCLIFRFIFLRLQPGNKKEKGDYHYRNNDSGDDSNGVFFHNLKRMGRKRSTDMKAGVNARAVGIHGSRNVRTTWYRYRDLNPGFQDENLMS